MNGWAKAGAAAAVLAAVGLAPPASTERVGVTTPDGNIGCVMDPWWMRCDVGSRNCAPPPRPANCPPGADYGQGIVLTADDPNGAAFVCAGDSVLNAGTPLGHRETALLDSVRCQMTPERVACQDFMNGKGFWMSDDGYEFF